MRTITVITANKTGLVAGLKWSALSDYKGGDSITTEVRSKAKLAQAEKIVIHSVDTGSDLRAALGMYAANDFERPAVKLLHSLAVASVYAFPEQLHLILAWRIDAKRIALVVIQFGIPIADEIRGEPEAIKLIKDALAGKMGAKGHKIFTNEPATFLNGELVEEGTLVAAISKRTRLKPVPFKPINVAIFASLVLGVSIGTALVYQRHVQAQKAALAARLEAEDPLPPYLISLATNIGKLGLERKSVASLLRDFSALKVWDAGWLLLQAECTAGQCIFTWERRGGTTAALLAANPNAEFLTDSTVDKVKLLHKVALVKSGLPSLQAAVPMKRVGNDYVNTYQLWGNAGLQVQQIEDTKEFKTWPTPVLGDLSRLPANGTLKARPISVTVPFTLAQEVVATTPAAVWWTSFILKYSPAEAKKNLSITFNGNTYVQ